MEARRIGRYLVIDRIAQGGMGEIYTARDERLDRIVAIKAILPELVANEDVRKRFGREARAAAALNHPFLCTIHEVLEEEGRSYIVMEYVEGETLRDRIARGPLTPEEVCRIGLETAEALAAAHAADIVHRDVSAANIMITRSGHAKLMDFGIARLERTNASSRTVTGTGTAPGTAPGTVPYMAPEVLRGEPAEPRSDLYGLGVALYAASTGSLPFAGSTPAVLISEILTRSPVSPRTRNPEVPWALERLILRLLEKDPAARVPSAESLTRELRALLSRTSEPACAETRSIAVLPFKALGGEPDAHLSLGLADATITELSSIKSLLVRPTAAILRYQGREVDPATAGRELAVDAVVDGSVQRSGSRLRITIQLVATADGRMLFGTRVTTSLEDMFEMQDEVSGKIASALEVELGRCAAPSELRPAPARSGDAYDLYLKGRAEMLKETLEDYNRAIEYFDRARALDPQFALAYAGLSAAYSRIAFTWAPEGDLYERAEHMCEKALALDPTLPEGRYLRARLIWSPKRGFDHRGALTELLPALAERPNFNEGQNALGIILFHVGMLDASVRAFEKAIAINPEDWMSVMHLGFCRYLQGAYRGSLDLSQQTARRMTSAWLCYQTALSQIQLGAIDDAVATADLASRRFPNDVLGYPIRGLIAAQRGDRAAALRQVELTEKNRKAYGHYHHAQYDVACIHALLGDRDEAMRSLGDAAHNGFPCYPFFEGDPLLEAIRSDEGFTALMNELRAECSEYGRVVAELSRH